MISRSDYLESVFVGLMMNMAFFYIEASLDWAIGIVVAFIVLGFFTGAKI